MYSVCLRGLLLSPKELNKYASIGIIWHLFKNLLGMEYDTIFSPQIGFSVYPTL